MRTALGWFRTGRGTANASWGESFFSDPVTRQGRKSAWNGGTVGRVYGGPGERRPQVNAGRLARIVL